MSWHSVWTTSYWPLGSFSSSNVVDNATEVYNALTGAGWTRHAACAVIGNLIHESTGINPGQFQQGYNYSWTAGGFGIAQWTPGTKVSDYIGSQAQGVVDDGAAQVAFLLSNTSQYNTAFLNPDGTSNYYNLSGLPYLTSMSQFSQSNASVDVLTAVWMVCWERPSAVYAALSTRQMYADYYNEYFKTPGTGTYRILVSSTGNGEAWASAAEAQAGETIYLTALPYGTDSFIDWTVVYGSVSIVGGSFVMPASDVKIIGNFTGAEPDPSPPVVFPIWWLWKFQEYTKRKKRRLY